ncbi:hypothetical protein PMAYCL1PPCAC_20836, partial [Pristionchus mayeri]
LSKSLALISKSTRLIVSLQNENCDFSINDDHTTLLFQPKRRSPISSVHLQLSTAEQGVIQSLDVPCLKGRTGSVRIDAFYPTVFGVSNSIGNVSHGDLEFLSSGLTGEASTFNLLVKLAFDGKISAPTLKKITSAVVQVDSIPVDVSKEMLGVTSDFFCNLFYGEFMEKNTGTFKISQVAPADFISLIDSITDRKSQKVNSVEHALSMLTLADRFCIQIPIVLKGVLPYLKKFNLDTMPQKNRLRTLKYFMELSSRCDCNDEFVSWIFFSCHSVMELSDVAKCSSTTLALHQKEFFRALTIKQGDETRNTRDKIRAIEKDLYKVQQALSAHLQTHTCHRNPDSLEWRGPSEEWFVGRFGDGGEGEGEVRDGWGRLGRGEEGRVRGGGGDHNA